MKGLKTIEHEVRDARNAISNVPRGSSFCTESEAWAGYNIIITNFWDVCCRLQIGESKNIGVMVTKTDQTSLKIECGWVNVPAILVKGGKYVKDIQNRW